MPDELLTANIILYCKKWTCTVDFYKNGLALPVLFENDWFVEFTLNAASRLSIADERRASIQTSSGAGMTLALEVADINTLWARMEKKKLDPTPVRTHPWNARVFYLFDPEGHRIEIWQKRSP